MIVQHPVVIFDGECNLCNGSVRFLFRRDPKGSLRFANLQSKTGKALLEKFSLPLEEFDSLVLVEGDTAFTHSTGALRTLQYLRPPWPVLGTILGITPAPFRDLIYNWIARNRYAWFGKTNYCQAPNKNLNARFLH